MLLDLFHYISNTWYRHLRQSWILLQVLWSISGSFFNVTRLLQVEIIQEPPQKKAKRPVGSIIIENLDFKALFEERLILRELNKAWEDYDAVDGRRKSILRKMEDMKANLPRWVLSFVVIGNSEDWFFCTMIKLANNYQYFAHFVSLWIK